VIALTLILLPLIAGAALWLKPLRASVTWILVGVSAVVSALAVHEIVTAAARATLLGFLRVDATSRLFLSVINPIFLGVSVHLWGRARSAPALLRDVARIGPFALIFLAASNAVIVANHVIVLWIALEITALSAAPLIVRRDVPTSRRAAWHYSLFSSVSLGLALLGFSCLARAAEVSGAAPILFVDAAPAAVAGAAARWQATGVALVILGLGGKLGLAPMYSWLPETYDEAPAPVTALLGAVQFNCALVVLLRVVHQYRPAHAALVSTELIILGVASMAASTLSIIATRNMRRLLAYASIHHAGVIAVGLGVGRGAGYALLLYVFSNAFIKAILFLTAARIEQHCRTKDATRISDLINELPYSGLFLMIGTFALLGLPPFGSFSGELLILSSLVSSGHMIAFAAFCVLITMTFVATGRTIFPMIWRANEGASDREPQTFLSASPKVLFLVLLVALGVYIPPVVNRLFVQVAASVEGS
jgi:hydrogenase-4 component F